MKADYMALLKRFAQCGKIIIAKVEGTVQAGGMGLVPTSDLVVATPASSLPCRKPYGACSQPT